MVLLHQVDLVFTIKILDISSSLLVQWGRYKGSAKWGITLLTFPLIFTQFSILQITRENDSMSAFTNSTSPETQAGSSINSYINLTLVSFQHQTFQTFDWLSLGY